MSNKEQCNTLQHWSVYNNRSGVYNNRGVVYNNRGGVYNNRGVVCGIIGSKLLESLSALRRSQWVLSVTCQQLDELWLFGVSDLCVHRSCITQDPDMKFTLPNSCWQDVFIIILQYCDYEVKTEMKLQWLLYEGYLNQPHKVHNKNVKLKNQSVL